LITPRTNKSGENLLALPHLSIRQLVYKILAALPIATHHQEGRNLLKASGIGPVLRFYAKVKHETEANRRTVGDLLNRWMLPIIEEGRKAVKDEQAEQERVKVCPSFTFCNRLFSFVSSQLGGDRPPLIVPINFHVGIAILGMQLSGVIFVPVNLH
jgi:hypothetical protein